MSKIVFLAVPYWLGRQEQDVSAIEAVRASGIAEEFGAEWRLIRPDNDENPVNAVNRAVAAAVQEATAAHQIPFIIAGDCTVCLGNMKGLEAFSPNVLWYDAHGDFNTPESSRSGFLGGMPLAAMVGMGNQDLLEGIGLEPVEESRIILSDGRDLDPEEAELVRDSEVLHLSNLAQLHDIDWKNAPLYIHFDCDVVRLEDLPAVSYPARGGPSIEETIASLRHAVRSSELKALHVTCWNNSLAGAEQSRDAVLAAIRVVAEELGA
jgi:arginase